MSHLSHATQKAIVQRHIDNVNVDTRGHDKLISHFENGYIHDEAMAPIIEHLSRERLERVLDSPHVGREIVTRAVSRQDKDINDIITSTPHLFKKVGSLGLQYLSSNPKHHAAILARDGKDISWKTGNNIVDHLMHTDQKDPVHLSKVFHKLATSTFPSTAGRLLGQFKKHNLKVIPADQLK